MLEKARMKGKKAVAAQPPDGEEYEDDGLCCTCGQQVGQQHNHGTGTGTRNGAPTSQGPGNGNTVKVKS
jgi:hypothetical protein